MDATEHLIHIAEQIGDGQLGGIAWGRLAKEARAELAALRAAPPKIDGVPTVPGWYWARHKTTPRGGWTLCFVDRLEPSARVSVPYAEVFEFDYSSELQDFTDYHGPLTPPKETT